MREDGNVRWNVKPKNDAQEKSPLEGSWENFEAWIRTQIGEDFIWKVRPRDTLGNREMVIDSIKKATSHNNGSFPKNDAFIERDAEQREE